MKECASEAPRKLFFSPLSTEIQIPPAAADLPRISMDDVQACILFKNL